MHNIGVAIVTLGRCLPLLTHLCRRWLDIGAELSVVGPDRVVNALRGTLPTENVRLHAFEPTPALQGDAIATAFEQIQRPFVLRQDDDCLPIGDEWKGIETRPSTITGIRLIEMTGQRHFDWATQIDGLSYLLSYDEDHAGAYITGAAQLWSPEARAAASYRGRPYRRSGDVHVCWEAKGKGIRLVPPDESSPLVVHLDRTNRPIPMAPILEL